MTIAAIMSAKTMALIIGRPGLAVASFYSHATAELAKQGDTNVVTMNLWLHKQIMMKLAAHGGKLPSDMKT